MTDKRFRVTISNTNAVSFVDVVENKQLMSITFKNKSDAIDCKNALMYQCDLLNALHEENQRLKQENAQFDILIKNNQLAYLDLEKENEQLKQFKENLFNTINMHLRMLPTARDNEFNDDDGDPSLYVGAIYMLETLKKELEE